jgi:hypothetical protein
MGSFGGGARIQRGVLASQYGCQVGAALRISGRVLSFFCFIAG